MVFNKRRAASTSIAATFIALLKSCAKNKDLKKGIRVHTEIEQMGLLEEQKSPYLASSLINMYVKCGSIAKAHAVHDELCYRNVVSWNTLIGGYVRANRVHEAIECYKQMQNEDLLSPDATTFVEILKVCGFTRCSDEGKKIHRETVRRGLLSKDVVLGTALVDMYAKCGLIAKAQEVHDDLSIHDIVSWNALIGGYIRHGKGNEALGCFEKLQNEGLFPNSVTFACILKACAIVRDVNKGKKIHDEIVNRGLLEKDVVLGTALVDMYAKCGMVLKAQQVHDEFPFRDTGFRNALIAGYAQHGHNRESLSCFQRMQNEGISPNAITFICILKACGGIGCVAKGKQIHDEIVDRGLLEGDVMLGSALVDMYAKCGAIEKAQSVHDALQAHNVVSWSALISGYVEKDRNHEALKCFESMREEGICPSAVTFICTLKACASIRDIHKGYQIHDEIVNRGEDVEKDVLLGTALVNMYAKCGVLTKAHQVLNRLPTRNITSWNALIGGYTQQGKALEALDCFEKLQNEGLSPDSVTFTCILKASGSTGSINLGKQIHNEVLNRNLLDNDDVLGTALVDMYAQCGFLAKAREVLEELPSRSVASWSALITGYAQQGQVYEALNCFECMQGEGLLPNVVTFVCVMNACSHSGLLDEAQVHFYNMNKHYGLTQTMEHHACMVVVFGYAGHFNKAISVIKTMPSSKYPTLWLALLTACRKWENVKVGSFAFDRAVELDNKCAGAYTLMANIYVAAGMRQHAQEIEVMKVKNVCLEKSPCKNV